MMNEIHLNPNPRLNLIPWPLFPWKYITLINRICNFKQLKRGAEDEDSIIEIIDEQFFQSAAVGLSTDGQKGVWTFTHTIGNSN